MSTTTVYSVPGMSYEHCVDALTTEVSIVDGVTDASIDLDARTVAVTGGGDAAIVAAIDEAGHDVAGTRIS